MLRGDFDEFAAYFALPQRIGTFDGSRVLTTRTELRDTFEAVRAHYKRLNVTDMARHCADAIFVDDRTIQSTHVSRLLSGPLLVQEAYPVLSILRKTDAGWRIVSSQYAAPGKAGLNAVLLGARVGV